MSITRALGLVAAACLAACTAEIQDTTVFLPGATIAVTTTTDVDNVRPAQTIPLTVDVQNIYLVEPTVTPPPEHETDAAHLVFTLDDESSTPLLVSAETDVVVVIPASTLPGRHTILIRVYAHDGTPTDTADEVTVNVSVIADDANVAAAAPPPPPQPIY